MGLSTGVTQEYGVEGPVTEHTCENPKTVEFDVGPVTFQHCGTCELCRTCPACDPLTLEGFLTRVVNDCIEGR